MMCNSTRWWQTELLNAFVLGKYQAVQELVKILATIQLDTYAVLPSQILRCCCRAQYRGRFGALPNCTVRRDQWWGGIKSSHVVCWTAGWTGHLA